MACGGGCCGSNKALPAPNVALALPAAQAPVSNASATMSSRAADASLLEAEKCCTGSEFAPTKVDECCGNLEPAQDSVEKADCSIGKSAGTEKCCSDSLVNGTQACCDDDCLLSVALQDCQEECKAPSVLSPICEKSRSENQSSFTSRTQGKAGLRKVKPRPLSPCNGHLSAARKRYGSVLQAMGCMCKALIAQGRESCCTTKQRLAPDRDMRQSLARSRSRGSSEVITACSTGVEVKKACWTKRGNKVEEERLDGASSGKPRDTKDGCCTEKNPSKGCGGTSSSLDYQIKGGCCSKRGSTSTTCGDTTLRASSDAKKDGCRSGNGDPSKNCYATETSCHRLPANEIEKSALVTRDIELGMQPVEHIVLSVQGMTCTGCETKLARSIASIPSAINGKTSIVLSRAEFDIDPSIVSPERAISLLGTATGFSLSKLSTTGHTLQVRVSENSKHVTDHPLPTGVLEVIRKDDKTISISYDPEVIKARDIVDHAFGRKLELAPVTASDNIAAGAKHVREVGYMTILSAALTIPVLIVSWAPLPPHDVAYQSASLGLATIVQVVVAGPFYSSALRSLIFSCVIEMDMLVVISTTAAYVFSVVSYAQFMVGKPLSTGSFFESSTLLVTLIMLGRFISALARQKAVESISVTTLQPLSAILTPSDNDSEAPRREIDARLLHYGDVFFAMPDSKIVTDGTVVFGSSAVDESMLTGESRLVEKSPGSAAIAGTVNGSGLLHVRVTRLLSDNTVSSIVHMVDQAKLTKPKIQEFADRIAGYFVPVIIVITSVVFCIWVGVNIADRHLPGSDAAVRAITYAIAVLIISCPCAIGLAVPMVIVIACGVGAEHGVVFKSSQSIESGWKATHVVFDKTGTLTQGTPTIVEEEFLGHASDMDHLRHLYLLASANKHPISSALAKYLRERFEDLGRSLDVSVVAGKGVEAKQDGKMLRLGNAAWLGFDQLPEVRSMQARSLTVTCFAVENDPVAIFGLTDSLRAGTRSVISKLLAKSVDVSILSGDDKGAVSRIAADLGIPLTNAKSHFGPEEKQSYVQALTQHKNNIVIFCGDGSNDAGALAQATIGVHMSTGTDIARSASDAVLMRPDLASLLTLMDISHAAHRRIVANFVWAFTYNLFAILLAAGAFVNARIPPQYAGLGEVVSVLPVVAVALQMKWVKF